MLKRLGSLLRAASRFALRCLKIGLIALASFFLLLALLPSPRYPSKQVEKNLPKLQLSDTYDFEPSIVRLYRNDVFFCSGVVIGKNYLLTAAHCLVDDNDLINKEEIKVVSSDGKITVMAKPVGVSIRMDHGLVMGDFSRIPGAKLISDHLSIPPAVLACGYPLGSKHLNCTVLIPQVNDAFLVKCSGKQLIPGQSGGPVFDKDVNVIGLNVQVYDIDQGGGSAYTPTVGILGEFDIE